MNPIHCPSCSTNLSDHHPDDLCPVCVLRAASDIPLQLPALDDIQTSFPDLEILECIGRGGMGIVYKARQSKLERIVALKILDPGLQSDPSFEERFIREAKTLAKLNHPNIISILDYGQNDDLYWLTMEYVDGLNLRDALQTDSFTEKQSLHIIPALCDAIQFAHDKGITHRDIKPENILLDIHGNVKIADFGIAQLYDDLAQNITLTVTGTTLGSTAYAAPEQIEQPHLVDHRADIYSIGVVFYEMLTGELPIGRFSAPSEKSPSDPSMDEVVFKALEKERERRHQQAQDLSDELSKSKLMKPRKKDHRSKNASTGFWKNKLLPISAALLLSSASAYVAAQTLDNTFLKVFCYLCGLGFIITGAFGLWYGSQQTENKLLQRTSKTSILLFGWLLIIGIPIAAASIAHKKRSPLGHDTRDYWIYQSILVFIGTMLGVLFIRTLFIKNLKPTAQRKLNWAMSTLALVITAITFIQTNRHADLWPAQGYYSGIIISSENIGKVSNTYEEDHKMIQQAIKRATESSPVSHDKYKGVSYIHFMADSRQNWNRCSTSFINRYNASVPAYLNIKAFTTKEIGIAHDWFWDDIERKHMRYRFIHARIMLSISLIGLCIAFTQGKTRWIMSGAIVIAFISLQFTPSSAPAISPPANMVTNPDLPALPTIRPEADFSSPEKAAQSVFDAMAVGDTENFRKGLSNRLNKLINQRNLEQRLMRRFKNNKTWSRLHQPDNGNGIVRVYLKSPSGSGSWKVILENGEWRLDDLPLDLHSF